jgi:hypothetical protein
VTMWSEGQVSMNPAMRYFAASLAIGAIAFWGSECLFWAAPRSDMTFVDLVLTWLSYGLCAAAVVSAVHVTGIRGWRALFLGGAILGWCVEGIIADTAYQGFPAQLVWTPLAWHALITSWALFGLCRAAVHWSIARQILGLSALGFSAAVFAQFWPLERTDLPDFGLSFGYLVGLGCLVPLANIVLDRIGPLPQPTFWVTRIAPLLLSLIWLIKMLIAPNPVRLAVPLLIAATLWIMRRLGQTPAPALSIGGGGSTMRHVLFLVAPITAAGLNAIGWNIWHGVATNIVFALSTSAVGLLAWLYLLWAALRVERLQKS